MSKCTACKDLIERTPEKVPYVVYEATVARNDRTTKSLILALIVAIVLIFATNIGWLIYESQFETFEYSYTQDGQGTNIIGNENEVNNGAET